MASVALAALLAYFAGFVVTFAWTRTVHRRHQVADPRAALAPALMGGAFGGFCVLLVVAAQQTNSLAI